MSKSKMHDTPFQQPMSAMLNAYGSCIATVLVPRPGDVGKFQEPSLRIVDVGSDGPPSVVYVGGLAGLMALRTLLDRAIDVMPPEHIDS